MNAWEARCMSADPFAGDYSGGAMPFIQTDATGKIKQSRSHRLASYSRFSLIAT